MRPFALLSTALALAVPSAGWCQDIEAQADVLPAAKLTDAELASLTGRFVLPNGVEIAIAITSDTVLNGQLVLRTVLSVDRTSNLQVFGRRAGEGAPYASAAAGQAGNAASGVIVTFDRQSRMQTITPTFTVGQAGGQPGSQGAPGVSIGAGAATPADAGLVSLPLVPGGPAIATADGSAVLVAVRNGAQVTFTGDRFTVANLLGPSVATALVNSANDRTIDTVTNVGIDLRDVSAYSIGSAQLQIQALAIDATRGMVR